MRNYGFSLLELMMAMAILAVVSGMLLMLTISMGSATQTQEAKITTGDEARSAMLQVVRQVRQASRASIPAGSLPGPVLTYRVAQDVSGNGVAVNPAVALELGPVRTIERNDDNPTQLIMTEGNNVTVLANNLMLDGANNNPAGFDRGIWFEQVGRAIRITIQSQRVVDASGRVIESTMVETVLPRN